MNTAFSGSPAKDPVLLVLNYHRIGNPEKNARYRGMFVTPAHLRRQIIWLKNAGFTILPVSEALLFPAQKTACLSFDDGYADNLQYGLPVLAQEGVRGSLYVITGDVGKKQHSWKEAGEKLPADLLSWDQIEKFKDAGWETGSHGHSHIHLGRKVPAVQEECIHRSQEFMKKYLGETAASFAYPYGSYNSETERIVKNAGFRAALTTDKGLNQTGYDPYRMRRLSLKGYRLHHFLKSRLELRNWLP